MVPLFIGAIEMIVQVAKELARTPCVTRGITMVPQGLLEIVKHGSTSKKAIMMVP